jgi:rod shape-determining protein MreC
MRNLLNFLARYNNLIVFLLLEGFAFYFLITGNSYHNSRVIKSFRGLTGNLEKKINNTKSYLRLQDINTNLASENAEIRNRLERLTRKGSEVFFSVKDTINRQQYVYTTAEIVSNSINKQKNYLTLNKGKKQGVNIDMAVTGAGGVIGIIVACSDNYSMVMSLLNLDFKLSARIKTNGYFGSLSWDGRDYRHAVLNEIPKHVIINVGDTIETTSYSAIFPKGILVGTISDLEKIGGDFYKISVLLSTDFKNLSFVSVIGNLNKTEQLELEKTYK